MKKPTEKERFCAAICYYKKLYNIDEAELCLRLGLSRSTLSKRLKTGEFTYSEILLMSELFYVSPGVLADGKLCTA